MSDYNMTRKVSGEVVSRFASMLEDLEDDYEETRNKMTWHYQLMRHLTSNGETYYAVHEYYVDVEGINGQELWTESPVSVDGESKSDVVWMLKAILNDIEKHGVKDYESDQGNS